MENLPFTEIISDDIKIRHFSPNVDSEELKWHQDLNDRTVTVIKSDGWKIQMGDTLPKTMYEGDVIEIPALKWHRTIKGEGGLVVEIKEKTPRM